jgi:hypothetical protein
MRIMLRRIARVLSSYDNGNNTSNFATPRRVAKRPGAYSITAMGLGENDEENRIEFQC